MIKMLYKEWLELWLENYVKPVIKSRSYLKYKRDVEIHIIPSLGKYELEELTPLVLQKFTVELANKKLATGTINGIISVLKNSIKSAINAEITVKNYTNSIIRPKICEKQVDSFSKQEQEKIEKYILNKRDFKLFGIIICLYTGLRIGELLSLTWSDIDFKKKILIVNKTCMDSWKNGKYVKILDKPKTENSNRIIPLSKSILEILKEIKKASTNDFIVPASSKYGVGVRSYQRTFDNLLKKLKIEHKGFHSLRHTFATRAIECGMNVKCLSEILGHKNPTITLKRYAHSMLEYKTEMMNKIGKILCI